MSDESVRRILRFAGIAAGATALLVIGVRAWRRSKEKEEKTRQEESLSRTTTSDTNAATITAADAQSLAQTLYSAMTGVGTEEEIIDAVTAKLRNGADWLLVIKAFGARPYGVYGAPMDTWYWTSSSEPLNLIGWFRKELSGSRLRKIEDKLTEYGINI